MRFLNIVPLVALAACGVPDGKALGELDEGDWKSLCASLANEPKTVTCDLDDTAIDVAVGGTAADCEGEYEGVFLTDCAATVGELRACDAAQYADPCLNYSATVPASCAAVFSCMPEA